MAKKQTVEVTVKNNEQAFDAIRAIGELKTKERTQGIALVSFMLKSEIAPAVLAVDFAKDGAAKGTWPVNEDKTPVGQNKAVEAGSIDGLALNTARQYWQGGLLLNEDGTLKQRQGKAYATGKGNKGAVKALIAAGLCFAHQAPEKTDEGGEVDKTETPTDDTGSETGNTTSTVTLNRATFDMIADLVQGLEFETAPENMEEAVRMIQASILD